MFTRELINIGAAFLSAKKLKSWVSRYLMTRSPSGVTVHCWTRPRGCTIAPGILRTVSTGMGIVNPWRTSLAMS